MAPVKSLEQGSKYNQYDLDGDGTVTDEEMKRAEEMIKFENEDKKEDQLRMMAWAAMGSMIVATAVLFSPLVSIERLEALASLIQMFYIAQAGVVATFFGTNAYISK